MPVKIIFLDVDGVLNAATDKYEAKFHIEGMDGYYFHCPSKVELLNKVIFGNRGKDCSFFYLAFR